MRTILALVFEGFQSSGVFGPLDVFNVLNTLWKQQGNDEPLYQCQLVAQESGAVTASNGTRVLADISLRQVEQQAAQGTLPDVILVPGIHHTGLDDLIQKLTHLKPHRQLLKTLHQKGVVLSANCSGVFLLAEAGLLDNGEATTAWWLNTLFQQRYPAITLNPHNQIIRRDNLYCTGAMSANISAMLQIAESHTGRQLVIDCARTMLIDANQDHMAPYLFLQSQSDHQDTLILSVESWMQRHISQPLDLKTLAAAHHVSERTLSRRFQAAHQISPGQYLQQLRVRHASLLLETTNLSLERVAERTGYGSTSTFRRLFKQATGHAPRAYRQLKQNQDGHNDHSAAEQQLPSR
ncbi:MAG: AraC family transcriptional regulator [Oceanospirillaceae bacterium]|nr:AraC family transcriptional regulator [Oceanospirillaceae bacterium]